MLFLAVTGMPWSPFWGQQFGRLSNDWGVGLPPAGDNATHWPLMGPLLANPSLRPSGADIVTSFDRFKELLRVRKSTPLFRLRTAAEINSRVAFYNTGPDQVRGLIVMGVSGRGALDVALLGSTTHHVIREGAWPVLTVRTGKQ